MMQPLFLLDMDNLALLVFENLYKQPQCKDDDHCTSYTVQVLNRLLLNLIPEFSGIEGLYCIYSELCGHCDNKKADLLGGFKVQLNGNESAHHYPEHQGGGR